jgi:hypothetical protein
MTAAQQTAAAGAAAPKPQKMIGEWFWRFLAVVMVVTVAWVLWIMYQINPQPLITPAGFAAAAKARASQDAKGVITPAAPAGVPAASSAAEGVMQGAASAQAEAPKPNVPAEPKEPPVNPERLKFSDSIETPIPERGKKK